MSFPGLLAGIVFWILLTSSDSGPRETGGPLVSGLQLVQPPDRAEGHPPDTLDEPQPQHGGEGPELADPEWAHLLERGHEQRQVIELDPGLGVGDEGDRDLVHPRVARDRAGGELGQLAVVAAGQALADLEDVLLDHVDVVQQPLAGRADVVIALGRRGQPVVGIGHDPPGLVEPIQQATPRARGARGEALCLRHRSGAVRQVLGTEELAPDRPGDELVEGWTDGGPAKTAGQDGTEGGSGDGGSRLRGSDSVT